MPAGSELDPTAAATVVETEDRARGLETVDEMMAEVPGARVTRLGTLGAFAGLSLRGADLDHTTVLLDDVPLDEVGGGAFDLGLVPLALLERVEVYRGGAPLWLGAGAIGGVVRLVTRGEGEPFAEASLGAGSFGRLAVHGAAAVGGTPGEGAGLLALVGYQRADGDYPYVHDRANADPSDDVELERQNANVDEGFGLMRARGRALGGRVDAIVLGTGRTGGLTSSPVEEPTRTRRTRTRALGVLSWERASAGDARDEVRESGQWRLRFSGSAGWERHQLTDLMREIHVATATDDRAMRLHGRASGEIGLTRALSIAAVSSYALERLDAEDALARVPVPRSERHLVGSALEARLHGTVLGARAEVRASGRLEASHAELTDLEPTTLGQERTSDLFAPTVRLGAALEPWRGVAFAASIASATRLPSFVELFGDRAFLRGNAALSPERAIAIDGGTMIRGRAGLVRGAIEARAFATFARDLVRWDYTGRYFVPANAERATIVGVEAGARGSVGSHLSLATAATWLDARDDASGRVLPLRPTLQLYARPEIAAPSIGPVGRSVLWIDVAHVGASFVDPSNVVALEPRTVLGTGAGVEIAGGRARLDFAVADLFDVRPRDLVGFPLPGRRFTIDLTVRTEDMP